MIEHITFELTDCQQDPIYAIAPIVIIGIIVAGAILCVAGVIIITKITKTKGKSIAILGMTEAGKTTLYRILQGRPYTSYDATATDDYDAFIFKYGDREIKIEKGRDIGGGENYIREYYKEMIETRDIVFFLFNAYKYMDDSVYAQDVRSRMDFVWNCLKRKYKDDNTIKSKLVTIGTHLDYFDKNRQKKLLKEFQENISGKVYAPMLHNNFMLVNLTKKEEFLEKLLKSKIF